MCGSAKGSCVVKRGAPRLPGEACRRSGSHAPHSIDPSAKSDHRGLWAAPGQPIDRRKRWGCRLPAPSPYPIHRPAASLQGYLAHNKYPPPRTLQQYTQGHMLVLGGRAVSYERGSPVHDTWRSETLGPASEERGLPRDRFKVPRSGPIRLESNTECRLAAPSADRQGPPGNTQARLGTQEREARL